VSLIKEDSMSKENTKQKPNAKKPLIEKRQAKKEKAEGKPLQIMTSRTYNGQVCPHPHDMPVLFFVEADAAAPDIMRS